MQIGISTVLYSHFVDNRINLDLFNALEKIAQCGYTHIEYNDQSVPHPFCLQNGEASRILQATRDLNLQIHSIHIPCVQLPDADIGSLNPKQRQRAMEIVKRTLDACLELDCPNAILHPGGALENLNNPETLSRVKDVYFESLQELCDFLPDGRIKIILENDNNPLSRIDALIKAISYINSDKLGICIDTGHAYKGGDNPALLIKQAGNLLEHLHIHDNCGVNDDHFIPGDGTINWSEVMLAIKEVSYQGVFMLECAAAKKINDPDKIGKKAFNISRNLIHKFLDRI